MENVVTLSDLITAFRGKKVFVTGHTGFKGAWLLALLHVLGAEVKGYALPPDQPEALYNLLPEGALGQSVFADIRDRDKLTGELLSFSPDFIFHLAAQAIVRTSYEIPADTFEVNVMGTAFLLEAMRKLTAPCAAVIITTDKVYENKEIPVLYAETDRLGGHDPYSASKACAEIVVSSFRNSFFDPALIGVHEKAVVTARAGNVIGGGDWSRDRIIPDIIRSLQKEEKVVVRNPAAVRPWQHVLEPLTGYLVLAAALRDRAGNTEAAYNFGPVPGDHLRVDEVVALALTAWGKGEWVDGSSPAQVHEATLLQLDISRALSGLPWQPRLTAAEAIDWTVKWYQHPPEARAAFTFAQIKNYYAV